MDTTAYLRSQGWLGIGHALNHASGRGIAKPIRVSQKENVLGVGKKKHDVHADQWWARAFDEVLKEVNTKKHAADGKATRVEVGQGGESLKVSGTIMGRDLGKGGLYGNFVRGELLGGTLGPALESEGQSQADRQLKNDMSEQDQRKNNMGVGSEEAYEGRKNRETTEVSTRAEKDEHTPQTGGERRQRRKKNRVRKVLAETVKAHCQVDAAITSVPQEQSTRATERQVRRSAKKTPKEFEKIGLLDEVAASTLPPARKKRQKLK